MRCTVPTNVPPSEKILKLYDAGRSGGAGITGRPWPGSLHTIRAAPGSLKHVQPALMSVFGVKPSAVAAVAVPSETAIAIKSANLIILFSFRRNSRPTDGRSNSELPAGPRVNGHAVRNRQPLRSTCIGSIRPVQTVPELLEPRRPKGQGEEGPPERAFSVVSCGVVCGSVVAHGLEVVRGCVIRGVRSELNRLHVGCPVVEPRPDACLDDLVDRFREAGERARRRPAWVH